MTKDRARKRAARDRAAASGERYVVARRRVEESPAHLGVLHELTHRVPGVPAHVDGGLQARNRRGRGARPTHQNQPNHHQPRVLIGWQNRIARLFNAK